MAAEIANVNEGHFCTEHRRSPFHKGSYGQAEGRKINREQYASNHLIIAGTVPTTPRPSKLPLQRIELGAANVAELPQRVFAIHRPNLYLLRCQVRLLVSVQNGLYHFFGRSQDARRRTKPNATQQSVDRYQFLRITDVVLEGVDQKPRALRDEIRVKSLSPDDLFADQVTAILMSLNDRRTDGRTQCADKRSKNSG